jgi:hypothetical protein
MLVLMAACGHGNLSAIGCVVHGVGQQIGANLAEQALISSDHGQVFLRLERQIQSPMGGQCLSVSYQGFAKKIDVYEFTSNGCCASIETGQG